HPPDRPWAAPGPAEPVEALRDSRHHDPLGGHGMTTTTRSTRTATAATMLNKVPEVTIYFWIIKILCTTVGESFADYINETLGFGLTNTTLVFSAALIVVMVFQFRH